MNDYTDDEKKLIAAAYGYEFMAHTFITNSYFDKLSNSIRDITTIPNFKPYTGMWIYDVIKLHGEDEVENFYNRYIENI